MYFHKNPVDDVYIGSVLENGSNMLEFVNRDSIGQIRFRLWDGSAFATTLSMSWNNINIQRNTTVSAGYSITGELVDTSSEKVKYDIKEADYDFTSIVKNIKPHTFKLNKEKENGTYKNHIGLIAENVEENIPNEIQNIVYEVDGVKSLNYVKMGSITWGAVRELIQENETMKSKIEHLETRLFEVENFIRDYVKPKPKAKAKSKN